jgi:hypothetical protein
MSLVVSRWPDASGRAAGGSGQAAAPLPNGPNFMIEAGLQAVKKRDYTSASYAGSGAHGGAPGTGRF